jgi:N-acetylmuramic acid 6-phosphate etherase
MNREDGRVAPAIAKVLPQIARAIDLAVAALGRGGRLVYLGAGTSGRLGVLDAAECIPTFGTKQVVAVMAGAPGAMFRPSEVSEDDPKLGARDLMRIRFGCDDVLVGISASGRTPYVIGGLKHARKLGSPTILLSVNSAAEARRFADITIAPDIGPEVLAGSTRLKAGSAQKMVLNMVSTATMARLGRVFSNFMIQMQLTNTKLFERGIRILVQSTGVGRERARRTLRESGRNLPVALLMLTAGLDRSKAAAMLRRAPSTAVALREVLHRRGT